MFLLNMKAMLVVAGSTFGLVSAPVPQERKFSPTLTSKTFYASYAKYQKMNGKRVNLSDFPENPSPGECWINCAQAYFDSYDRCMATRPGGPYDYEYQLQCDAEAYNAQVSCEFNCY